MNYRHITYGLAMATCINLVGLAAYAQTAKQLESNAKQIGKAEQSLVMAQCKLDWLKGHAGVSKSSPAYFSFMAECLTKTADARSGSR